MSALAVWFALQAAHPLAIVDDPLRPEADILHYELAVSIPDNAASIAARATVRYLVRSGPGPLVLDFDSALVIDSITAAGQRLPPAAGGRSGWQRRRPGTGGPGWVLAVPRWGAPGDTLEVTVYYHGRPRDGLILAPNHYGAPTAFADNWPDRAHYWFPCRDHPSDKATAALAVEVPAGWKAVANGELVGLDSLAAGRTRWRWRTGRPIPVYTIVLGAGRLAVTPLQPDGGLPQSVWTFPEDSAFALQRPFRRAALMVQTLSRLIGPFPYAKLAHVESSTRFGGMENSSAIFYAQTPYVERTMSEEVVAHETAHQWFGDAVTERDWHHLWLSEGFASYLGPLFFELVGEPERFREAMERQRRVYFASRVVDRPILDTAEHTLTALLNDNNYPKAAWVLHQLRGEIGDSAFFAGLRAYYAAYRDSTALSADFAAVMEQAAGRSLDWFFRQWLLQPGYPRLAVSWSYQQGELAVEVRQTQPAAWGYFRVRLPLVARFASGARQRVELAVQAAARTVARYPLADSPVTLAADPEGSLLAEVTVVER